MYTFSGTFRVWKRVGSSGRDVDSMQADFGRYSSRREDTSSEKEKADSSIWIQDNSGEDMKT